MNITKCLCLAVLLALTAGAFPYNLHAGKLTSLLRTTDAQDFVDITEALKTNDLTPAETVPDYMRKSVPPEEGNVYVILTFSVEAGRSISIADYVLSADGSEYECCGLASQKADFFDPRCFKLNGPTTAKLLFKCPENAENCDVLPAPGFPLAPVKNLVLFKKAEPPAPESAPATNEEAAPAAAAGAEATEATETTETPAEAPAAEEEKTEEEPVPTKPIPAKPTAKAKPAPAKPAPAKPAEEAKPAPAKPAEEAKPAPPAPKPAPKPKQEEESWF
ncbi:MAG: hypothetical protein IKP00_12395 [Victivallales bacterium]|nr:hypothetical protein [Victivallales bacterium]